MPSFAFSTKWIWLGVGYFNPLVPDAHYSERQDEPFSLQI